MSDLRVSALASAVSSDLLPELTNYIAQYASTPIPFAVAATVVAPQKQQLFTPLSDTSFLTVSGEQRSHFRLFQLLTSSPHVTELCHMQINGAVRSCMALAPNQSNGELRFGVSLMGWRGFQIFRVAQDLQSIICLQSVLLPENVAFFSAISLANQVRIFGVLDTADLDPADRLPRTSVMVYSVDLTHCALPTGSPLAPSAAESKTASPSLLDHVAELKSCAPAVQSFGNELTVCSLGDDQYLTMFTDFEHLAPQHCTVTVHIWSVHDDGKPSLNRSGADTRLTTASREFASVIPFASDSPAVLLSATPSPSSDEWSIEVLLAPLSGTSLVVWSVDRNVLLRQIQLDDVPPIISMHPFRFATLPQASSQEPAVSGSAGFTATAVRLTHLDGGAVSILDPSTLSVMQTVQCPLDCFCGDVMLSPSGNSMLALASGPAVPSGSPGGPAVHPSKSSSKLKSKAARHELYLVWYTPQSSFTSAGLAVSAAETARAAESKQSRHDAMRSQHVELLTRIEQAESVEQLLAVWRDANSAIALMEAGGVSLTDDDIPRLKEGASAEDVASAQRRLRTATPLPPSYASFLQLSDGLPESETLPELWPVVGRADVFAVSCSVL